MDETRVSSYGLHWDGAVAWLVQGRGGTNFVGLKKQTPFAPPRGACNHLIPTAAPIPDRVHWEDFMALQDTPALQPFLPIPHEIPERISFMESTDPQDLLWLTTLSRLSSPIRSVLLPAWTLRPADLQKELQATNIQPLVVTGMTSRHQALITAAAELSYSCPRSVLFVGDDSLVLRPGITRLPAPKLELEKLLLLPMENLGAVVLRRFARSEDVFAPMESRESRRARMIQERNAP